MYHRTSNLWIESVLFPNFLFGLSSELFLFDISLFSFSRFFNRTPRPNPHTDVQKPRTNEAIQGPLTPLRRTGPRKAPSPSQSAIGEKTKQSSFTHHFTNKYHTLKQRSLVNSEVHLLRPLRFHHFSGKTNRTLI